MQKPVDRWRRSMQEYPPLLRTLGVGIFLNAVGLSFVWPMTTVYIHEHLGRSLTVAGLVLLFNQAAATLGSMTGGILFDRIGPRRVMMAGLLGAGVSIAIPGLGVGWALYVAAMIAFGFTVALVRPPSYALAARIWPARKHRAFNFLYVMTNLGVAVGTALGGVVAEISFQLSFFSAALFSLAVAAVVFLRIPDRPQPQETPSGPPGAATGNGALPGRPEPAAIYWPPILALFVAFFVLHVSYGQWASTIPVYMRSMGISVPLYSLLWAINGALIVVAQPLVSMLLRLLRRGMVQLLFGVLLYGVSFALALRGPQYPVFVASMVVLTLGEMILWPGIPAAVAQLSPPSRTGFLQGFIDNAMLLGRMVAPIVGGFLYDRAGIGLVLTVVIALQAVPVIGILVYAWLAARAPVLSSPERAGQSA